MRTPTEALKEVRDRLTYFCARLDGKYDPPWAQELVGIIDDALAQDAPMSQGNAAKLREALVQVQKKIKYLIGNLTVPNSLVASRMEINGIINAALAAPARNCDKYATADEALKAQEQMFNDSNFANGECKLGCPECDNPRVGCKIAWLFATATEQEGGAE